jgi:glycine/D-amino acid oxidase-like deaminating enzyme
MSHPFDEKFSQKRKTHCHFILFAYPHSADYHSPNNNNMSKAQQQQQKPQPEYYDVIIVGAGVAGASTAYHLSNVFAAKKEKANGGSSSPTTPRILVIDAGSAAGEGVAPRCSGTATMDDAVAPTIKMMSQLFAGSSEDFARHHGGGASDLDSCRRYLNASKEGLVLQKHIAKEVLQLVTDSTTAKIDDKAKKCSSSSQEESDEEADDASPPIVRMRELGSYYVGFPKDRNALRHEFELLLSLGKDVCPGMEWIENLQEAHIPGISESDLACGIYFPGDAIIDSSYYAKSLLKWLVENHVDQVTVRTNTKVKHVLEDGEDDDVNAHNKVVVLEEESPTLSTNNNNKLSGMCSVLLESGEELCASHVVMATGGLFPIPRLQDLLRPCYSYLVHVPVTPTSTNSNDDNKLEYSANFFTWGYTHDWAFTNGKVRCSGEDHFSANKAPHYQERCRNLCRWTMERYNHNKDQTNTADTEIDYESCSPQYGVYTETPDMAPLVGQFLSASSPNSQDSDSKSRKSRICYLMGCNAWGQAILSFCSSLIPGLLGYQDIDEDWTPTQRDVMSIVSIRRFSHLSA